MLLAMSLFATRPLAIVADDDPEMLTFLCEILDDLDYDTIAVDSGAALLDLLATARRDDARDVDLVVTDVFLPGIDGLHVAEELRADGWLQPILVLSAAAGDDVRERVHNLGRAAFLSKIIADADDIIDAVAELRRPTRLLGS